MLFRSDDDDDILIISDDGTMIRMAAKDISTYGRFTQGVRLMRVAEGSKVISIARTEPEEDEEAIDGDAADDNA